MNRTLSPFARVVAAAFHAALSDPCTTGTSCFSIRGALDQVDSLNSQAPILGTPCEPDSIVPGEPHRTAGQTLEAVIPELVSYLQGMFIWDIRAARFNIVPTRPSPALISVLLPLIYSPNLCSDESGAPFFGVGSARERL